MADMALGLTKKAVEGTVSRVLAAIDEDTKQKTVGRQDLRFIVDEFQMMQSFLEMVHDNKKHTSNKVVKMWVRQLRQLAFDVEDCAEFVTHLDTTSAKIWWSWVWRVVPLPSCMTPAWVKNLFQAFAQLKELKARVDEVSQRYTRYNLLGGDDSGSSTAPPPVPSGQLDAAAFPSTVDILRDLWKANAKQSSSLKCNLNYLVADGRCNELRVISVWRSTGVDAEAAHILNAAYYDPEICKEFKARARVKLMHPFNIKEFLKSLLNQLYVTCQQQDTLAADLLLSKGDSAIQDKLRKLLSKDKYLIVLEDLYSLVEWDLIRLCLPDCRNGSRIVISTHQLGIALSCTGEPYRVLQLALLPNDRYIYAFYKPSGIGITELLRQLGHRRVISLEGDKGHDTASLVRDVYETMKNKTAAVFKGVNFEKFIWVNVPSPFSLEGFWRCLPSYAFPAYKNNPKWFIWKWKTKVCNSPILFVFEGLQSKEDWDLIKNTGLVPEDTKSCIIVIANEEAVVKHCEDDSWRKMDDKEQEEAKNAHIIGPLFPQKEKYYSWGHHRFSSHGCSLRIEEAIFQFEPFITQDQEQWFRNFVWHGMRRYGVHAVWGPTGVGKSALVRFCYYGVMAYSLNMLAAETEVPERVLSLRAPDLFERFGWVDVPERFDLAEFSRRLLLDFSSYDPGEMEKTAVGIIQGHNPIQRCYETIRNQKCLVIIDGLRSKCDWDCIKQAFLCHRHRESCIVVLTIDESIAKHCVMDMDGQTFHIRPLDEKSAIDLFIKVANKKEYWDNIWTEQKLKHANRIVPKCGGLPKIIDAVAKSDSSFWQNINDDLVTKLKNGPQFGHLRGVFSWMHYYFDGCSDSVKPCVFYLSVFPTNYKIRKAHLMRRWITEGYTRDTTGSSAKENAESLFDELVNMGIIQKIRGTPLCQISGIFREYIISHPMEDNLVFGLEGNCKPNMQRTVQHLTIMKSWEREQENVFKSIDVSRLRSLTVYGKWESFFITDDKMKRIRVLDLEGTSSLKDCDLDLIFGILLTLKFICLRGCKSITCLPKTLGGLRQLESLDVRGTSIVTLPWVIIKLQKIHYVRAGMFLPFEDWTSAASEDDSDDAIGTQQPGATPTPEAEGSVTSQPQATILQDKEVDARRQNNCKVGCCWTSRLSRLSPRLPCNNTKTGVVEVPEGIEDMPALRTLGTVNIKSPRGMDFLRKLKGKTKLPQLLKLSVNGINKENWKDLCDALSAHPHLESLSLGLDKDFTGDMCFDNPPKALKSLTLYGHVHSLQAWTWIKDRLVVNKLQKFDLEVIISSQEDMDQLEESLLRTGIPRRLCIKPTHQVTKLEFMQIPIIDYAFALDDKLRVLKIDCSSALQVVFPREYSIASSVNVLIIHCSEGSDFRISGLNHLDYLDTVWLKGFDKKAEYVADLKDQISGLERKPVFKFEKLESA